MGCCEFLIIAFAMANVTNNFLNCGLEKVDTWSKANSNQLEIPNFVYPLHNDKMWIPSITCSNGHFVELSDLKKSHGNLTFETVRNTRYIGLYLNMERLNMVYGRCRFSFLGLSTTSRLHWILSNAIVHIVISFKNNFDSDCRLKLEQVNVVRLQKITLARRTGFISKTLSSLVEMITSVLKNSVIKFLNYHLTIGIKQNLPEICKGLGDYYSSLL